MVVTDKMLALPLLMAKKLTMRAIQTRIATILKSGSSDASGRIMVDPKSSPNAQKQRRAHGPLCLKNLDMEEPHYNSFPFDEGNRQIE
jgi:hypothetical protein